MEEALVAYLLAYTPLTAKVGQRINYVVTPQNAAPGPRLVLTVVSSVPEYADDGEAQLTATRVQADSYATTQTDALAVARLVFARLSAVKAAIGGVDFQTIEMVSSAMSFEEPPDGVRLHRVRQDFMIWHNA